MFRKQSFLALLVFFVLQNIDTLYGTVSNNLGAPITFNEAFERAEIEFSRNNFDTAVKAYQAALNIKPTDQRVKFRLGQAFLKLERNQEALSLFQELLREYPQNLTIRFELARALVKCGQIRDALPHLEIIIRANPQNLAAKALYDSCKTHVNQNTIPRVFHENIENNNKNNVQAKSNLNTNRFIPLKQTITKKTEPVEEDKKVFIWGGPKEETKKQAKKIIPAAAVSMNGYRVSDFLMLASDSLGITIEYAKYCLEKGDLDGAFKKLIYAEELLKQNSSGRQFLEVQILKALTCLYKADIREFGRVLMTIKPMLSKATLDSFFDIYNKAVSLKDPIETARLIAGVAMGADHFAIAVKILEEIVGEKPNDSFALRLLGHAQLENRDYEKAEKTFLEIYRLSPTDPEACINLARFYITANVDFSKARFYVDRALQLNPSDERGRIIDGILEFVAGDPKRGIEILKVLQSSKTDQGLAAMVEHLMFLQRRFPNAPETVRSRLLQDLALPGTKFSTQETLSKYGEDMLRRGSPFYALKFFLEARNLAEIGRVYLTLASNLAALGEEKTSAIAAGFGMNALKLELQNNPNSSKAYLYLALYYYERQDHKTARNYVEAGLRSNPNSVVKRRLEKLREELS